MLLKTRYGALILLLAGCTGQQEKTAMPPAVATAYVVDTAPSQVAGEKSTTASEVTKMPETKIKSSVAVTKKGTANEVDLDYIMGKFEPVGHPDFVLIDQRYCSDGGMYLRKETYTAFQKMHAAALEAGITLNIRSATRSFWHQKKIWEAKWNGGRLVDGKDLSKTITDPAQRALKILEYSAMPGASRHHWGTDIDLNELTNGHFEQGIGLKTYEWLKKNGAKYGFCQPYTAKGEKRPAGYNEEKWHWSYKPLSEKFTEIAREQLKDDMIKGFTGAETATKIGIVAKYVLGINQECF
jgi:LAS superfamily LD-carboxypeptidase LdcB